MKNHLTFRLLLIGLSLIISFLYGLHHLLWLHNLNWNYKQAIFVTSFKPYDANHYLAQIKEIYEGNYLFTNAFIAEYKNVGRTMWPMFPYYLAALTGKLLHLETQYLAVFMDFILPPLIFLLAYVLLFTVSGVRSLSLTGAFVLVLMPHILRLHVLFALGSGLLHVLKTLNFSELIPPLWDAHAYHNGFSRPINPQLTYLFLLAALLFFFKGLMTLRHRDIGLAILFGIITSYSYVYFSIYLYLFWGIFAVISIVLNNRVYVRQAFIALSVTLVFALPFWYSIFRFSDRQLTQMALMQKDHTPIVTPQVLFTILLCIIIVICIRKESISQLVGVTTLSLLLSGIGCLNQHVITGINVQPWHYEVHLIPQATILTVTLFAAGILRKRQERYAAGLRWLRPVTLSFLILYGGLACIVLSVFVNSSFVSAHLSSDGVLSLASRKVLNALRICGLLTGVGVLICSFLWRKQRFMYLSVRFSNIFYALIIACLVFSVGIVQYRLYYGFIEPHLGNIQQLSPALKWFNEHTEKESVVLCSLNYTDLQVVIPIYTHNNLYVAPFAECYALPSLVEIRERMYNILYFMGITSLEDFEKYKPNVNIGGSFEEYQKKLQKNLYTKLKTYRVDYLFYGPLERESFKVNPGTTYPFLKEVYTDNVVTIYQIL